jgi:hypothetical protein
LVGFGKLGEFLKARLVVGVLMTLGAAAGRGKGHEFPGIRIGMTGLAFQAERQVLFVAISKRLLRRRRLQRIIGHSPLRSRLRLGSTGNSDYDQNHQGENTGPWLHETSSGVPQL